MNQVFMTLFWVAVFASPNVLRADHNTPTRPIDVLLFETGQLERIVSMSPLAPAVKNQVFIFGSEVRMLASCLNQRRGPMRDYQFGNYRPNSFGCRQIFQRAEQSFVPVSRFLWDTQWQLPQVFNAYMQTQQALHFMRNGYIQ